MKRIILAILDGYGLAPAGPHNAVTLARTPFLDKLWRESPNSTLITSGEEVGLPAGQMGNSEVGHLNIGAGRVVYQDITRIDLSIRKHEFHENSTLLDLLDRLKKSGATLHLMGLVSDGGVHSSLNHVRAILETCKEQAFDRVVVHAFTDGRDTPPHSGRQHLSTLQEWMHKLKVGRIGTVVGRYYAMDRDNRWERVERAYRALCFGEGKAAVDIDVAMSESYSDGITDEFVLPIVMHPEYPRLRVSSSDGVLFFNFRADRTRQLTQALTNTGFSAFDAPMKVDDYVTMTKYHEEYTFPVLFAPQPLTGILGQVLSENGLKQLRIAETEKYPHVTFFFNGGDDQPFPLEERILVPSPKVATYDLQPEMSEPEVTRKLCEAIRSQSFDFICVNFANCDMVGHTGVLEAAIQAVQTANHGAQEMCTAAKEYGYAVLITADHGNAEQMWDEKTNGPHTAHTTNPVRVALFNAADEFRLRDGGVLGDLAPTILEYMGIPKSPEMSGTSLLVNSK
ncbi:MAG: 2,3-bisphosphoglycerate-independent phosphoglycerate mutase [Calditrichaeota bacterium]|nr:2,3-bisphosphoglycerate-independent phosphoglycerate mutase [Calditrichota bacterium]MCB9366503.1 2,3-bisphosphoglycerate-independent phosphoglycerate mutase [Calditrichota bacterium]MCB9391239.1 2,3-bisphosphoglycerate-independent phosphoglycerate mutase [Calditrichota bacterium]